MLTDKHFMEIAHVVSTGSKCVSKKVGAVIVNEGRILSNGYNGTPKGYPNCCDVWDNKWTKEHHEWSRKHEIHAEMNAINWAARQGIKIEGATIYCTFQPCPDCTKNMIAAGIVKIVYDTPYEHNDQEEILDFITTNNIEYVQI